MKKTYLRNAKGQFVSNKPSTQPRQPKIQRKTQQRNAKGQFVSNKPSTTKTKPKLTSVSTSRTQLQPIQTSNKKIQAFSTNITLNFKKPINTNMFKLKYNYLLRIILSKFKNINFNKKLQVNIKSKTLFIDNKKQEKEGGSSTGNQRCSSIIHLKNALLLQFDLIKSLCFNSFQSISFIDLTITLYQF